MALVYATGTKRNDLYTGITTRRQLLDSINTTLVAAGWTSAQTKAFVRVDYTGQPANTNTIVLNGKTYTFQTVLTNSDGNVQIGATALESYQNLKAAINLEAGAGTKYAAATTAHTTMEVPSFLYDDNANPANVNPTSATLKIQAKTAGTGGRALPCSETLANATLTFSTTECDGYKWDCAVTPEGMRCSVWGFDADETGNPPNGAIARFQVSDLNRVVRSHTREPINAESNSVTGGFRLGLTNSSSWRVIANKHCFWVVVDGQSTNCVYLSAGAISLNQTSLSPFTVTAASNATPIQITTSAAHGLSTGNTVCTRNIGGNLAANGTFTVTVVNATQFTLDGSVGSGAYTSGGVVAKVDTDVVEAIFGFASGTSTADSIGRSFLGENGSTYWVSVNGQNFLTTAGIGAPRIFPVLSSRTDDAQNPTKFYDGATIICEPLIGWGTSAGAQARILGQLYDAAIILESMTIDQAGSFDSKSWVNLTDSSAGSTTLAEGSIVVLVP